VVPQPNRVLLGASFLGALVLLSSTTPVASQQRPPAARPAALYYPGAGDDWERRPARQVGMDSAKVAEAIALAIAGESKNPRNLEQSHYQSFGREPYGEAVAPFKDRGDPTGIILRGGYVVAEWGEPNRVDMTFSVTKSFVSSVVGLAYDRKMIRSLNDKVRDYVGPVVVLSGNERYDNASRSGGTLYYPFETPHNRTITWDHMLRQVSDWEGTLWGKPEWADRPSQNPAEWRTRPRNAPGTVYEYNDVRVNALALAALEVWRRPLPQVLREYIMDPIGASNTWRWLGYEGSWVLMDGQAVQSVAGGGHWGGGMFINARDMARFGLLTLRRGKWKDRQLLSEEWVKLATTPTPAQPTYGFMNWFLNTDKKYIANAPASAWVHVGNGNNIIYVDPENDIVAVVRWIDTNASINNFVGKLLGAIDK
jgi:CubicO group peptidase (beta-lactamase class C family)